MWSQRNKDRAVWSKVPRPWVRTNVSQMCLTRFRASAAFCLAKYLFFFLLLLLLCLLVSISCVSHVGSPSQSAMFPPAQGSLLLPPLPAAHTSQSVTSSSSAASRLLQSLISVVWGFFPDPREPEVRGQNQGLAEPWGKGCGQAQPHLPPGHTSFNQPVLHKDSHTRRAHRIREKTEMNLDALFQQIQLTEKQAGEKRRLIQQGLHPGRHLVGQAAAPSALNGASISPGKSRVAPLCCHEGSFVGEGSAGSRAGYFSPMAPFYKNVTFTSWAHSLTGFCCVAAKFDINRSYEKINHIKEELSAAKMKLETKVSRHAYSIHNNGIHYIYKYMTYYFRNRFIKTFKEYASPTE